ncbi:MAG: D-cysteine desulfhydrase family protein [Caldilineales bacterium]|nr:D-cysteine desulfhydrase family protein [Caldilineales bacterium]MDW8318723.1 D-cysteine desulfhydrase family protein [Anaerolineae bacterium]
MFTDRLPFYPLAHRPTPLEDLPRLRAALQGEAPPGRVPRLLIKRDDQTGLAAGGNKTRKLELLLGDALRQSADTLITVGAPQSNHCRQTAAAAARAGLRCVLVLGGSAPMLEGGNLLLDRLLGAEIVWAGGRDRLEVMAEVAEAERAAGRAPYLIPYGGSNAVGAAGYAAAMEELCQQLADRGWTAEHVVVATSSGGTQAGLAVGALAQGFSGRLHGISIDAAADRLRPWLAELAGETARLLGLDLAFAADDFIVHDAYLGGGYGVVGDAEREAIVLLARSEGILVDPVYTARALAGLLDLIRRGHFRADETVVFWHTGGLPALFAYAEQLGEPRPAGRSRSSRV